MNIDYFSTLALKTFLQNCSDMLFFKDTNLVYRGGSRPFAEMVGVSCIEEIIGKSDFEILPPELALEYTEDDKRVLKSGVNLENKIEPITAKDGKKRYSSTSKFLIYDENNTIVGLCGYARDVTAQMLLLEETEMRELANQMFDDVLQADITENRLLCSQGSFLAPLISASEYTTFTEAIEAIANKYVHPDYRPEFLAMYDVSHLFSQYSKGEMRFSHSILQAAALTEGFRWATVSSRLYFSSVSGTLRMSMFFTDIDDERRSRELLKKRAQTDALTGLYNRRSTIEKIVECITSYGRTGRHALLFIDLDNFKQINDCFGHTVGDDVLLKTANVLKTLFRKDDIIGRVGGDEFLVLLKNISSAEEAKQLTDKIFNALPLKKHIEGVNSTCSVGISLFNNGDKSFDTLYSEADKAMYAAKESGRNQAVIYSR